MTQTRIDEVFSLYATTAEPRERQRAFTELVTLKALPKQADDPRFGHGLQAWQVDLQRPGLPDDERLLAIAELVRAGQVVKSKVWAERISDAIRRALSDPLPPARLLKDADERLNLARACSFSKGEWIPRYAAQAVGDEDTGEKARSEFFGILLARAGSLALAFTLLAEVFSSIRFQTEAPGDSMGKRLVRTLAAMRPVLLASTLDAGAGAGKQFGDWLRASMRASGKPKEEKTQVDLTREVALTLHDLVRRHFSIATEVDTFTALKICRGFFPGVSWPAGLKETLDLLVQDVSEALLMLGRQDVPQQGLLDQLELVCGVRERAQAVARQLAEHHADLPERIREWLRRGRLVTTQAPSNVLQLSLLDANDSAVGLALIEARKLGAAEETLDRIIGTIEIYEPGLAGPARSYAQKVRDTTTALQEIANRRGISLVGTEGEEMEFSAKYFDLLRSITGPVVTVKRPAIVRTTGAHAGAEVILKGLAE